MEFFTRTSLIAATAISCCTSYGEPPRSEEAIQTCVQETRSANNLKLALGRMPYGYLNRPDVGAAGLAVGAAAGYDIAHSMAPKIVAHPDYKNMLELMNQAYQVIDEHVKAVSQLKKVQFDYYVKSKNLTSPQIQVSPGQSEADYVKAMKQLGSVASEDATRASYNDQVKLQKKLGDIVKASKGLGDAIAGSKAAPLFQSLGIFDSINEYEHWATRGIMANGSVRPLIEAKIAKESSFAGAKKYAWDSFGKPPAGAAEGVGTAAGLIGGMMLAEAADETLILMECGFSSLGPQKVLKQVFSASGVDGCTLSENGSRQLAGLDDTQLRKICELNPTFEMNIHSQLQKAMAAKEGLPKPQAISADCDQKQMQLNIDNRNYTFQLSHDGPTFPYVIKTSVRGRVTKPPVEFSCRFDPITNAFACDDEKDGTTEDQLNDIYSQKKGKQTGDPAIDRRSTVAEGLNLAKSFVPSFVGFCFSGDNQRESTPGGAPPASAIKF